MQNSENAYQRVEAAIREAELSGARGEPLSEEAAQYAAAFDGIFVNGRPAANPVRKAYLAGIQQREDRNTNH